MELPSVQLLKRAVELDKEEKYGEAIACYEQGIRLLLQASKEITDITKKNHYMKKINEYLGRAELLKIKHREQQKQSQHTLINIPKDAVGYGYEKIFSCCLDDKLTHAAIRDPYIRNTGQVYNLQRFCEITLKHATNIKKISLLTTKTGSSLREETQQQEGLKELKTALALRNVTFEYTFSDTLHDRDIQFDNGWTVQLGRGLSYFQPLEGGRFAMGSGDYDIRPCLETTITLFHSSSLKQWRDS